MNERIRELEKQATSHMPGHLPYDGLTFDVFDKEKFAELIVRECMTNLYIKGHDDAVIQLREEFGVEL